MTLRHDMHHPGQSYTDMFEQLDPGESYRPVHHPPLTVSNPNPPLTEEDMTAFESITPTTPEPLPTPRWICHICSGPIPRRRGVTRNQVCSPACGAVRDQRRRDARTANRATDCPICGGPIKQDHGNQRKFCSTECRKVDTASRYKPVIKPCRQCGTTFTGPGIYCTPECRLAGYAAKGKANVILGPAKKFCPTCGKQVIRHGRARYCSDSCKPQPAYCTRCGGDAPCDNCQPD